jgi:integrase
VLTPPELKAIWNACGGDTYSTIVKLLMLTGQRKSEIANLELDGDTAVLPAPKSKNGKEHRFPVSAATQELLKKPRTWGGWSKSKVELDKACGVAAWTLHDLRLVYHR